MGTRTSSRHNERQEAGYFWITINFDEIYHYYYYTVVTKMWKLEMHCRYFSAGLMFLFLVSFVFLAFRECYLSWTLIVTFRAHFVFSVSWMFPFVNPCWGVFVLAYLCRFVNVPFRDPFLLRFVLSYLGRVVNVPFREPLLWGFRARLLLPVRECSLSWTRKCGVSCSSTCAGSWMFPLVNSYCGASCPLLPARECCYSWTLVFAVSCSFVPVHSGCWRRAWTARMIDLETLAFGATRSCTSPLPAETMR